MIILPNLMLALISVSVSIFFPGKSPALLNRTAWFAGSSPSCSPSASTYVYSSDSNTRRGAGWAWGQGFQNSGRAYTQRRTTQPGPVLTTPSTREQSSCLHGLQLLMRAHCPAHGCWARKLTHRLLQVSGPAFYGICLVFPGSLLAVIYSIQQAL